MLSQQLAQETGSGDLETDAESDARLSPSAAVTITQSEPGTIASQDMAWRGCLSCWIMAADLTGRLCSAPPASGVVRYLRLPFGRASRPRAGRQDQGIDICHLETDGTTQTNCRELAPLYKASNSSVRDGESARDFARCQKSSRCAVCCLLVTGHEGEDRRQHRKGRISPETLPALNLISAGPPTRPRSPVEPGHDIYLLAAWAYHHGHEIKPFDAQRGFFEALSAVWPVNRGPRRTKDERVRMAYLLKRQGAKTKEVAAVLDVTISAARKYVQGAKSRFETDPRPLHEVIAIPRAEGVPDPPDPGTLLGLFDLVPAVEEADVPAPRDRAVAKSRELGFDLFAGQ